MINVTWNSTVGWGTPQLLPYGPLSLMPTASVLHYATECFEGMKIYRGHDGRLRLFRPDRNCARMLTSATRIALPAFEPSQLQKLVVRLASEDGRRWLPISRKGHFLYIRPTMIASAPALGVQKPQEALLYIIACCFPSLDEAAVLPKPGPALSTSVDDNGERKVSIKGERPGMKLLASNDDMVRAWPGGFGYAKVGANYGPTLIAQAEARQRGFSQILWLLGPQCEVTEAGASNFFVLWRNKESRRLELVTAPLDDKLILDGVTRRSVIELTTQRLCADQPKLKSMEDGPEAVEVVERKFTMAELEDALDEGRLLEAFVAGTAVCSPPYSAPNHPIQNPILTLSLPSTQFFITPVSLIHFHGKDLEIPLSAGNSGRYTQQLKTWLKNIMYGKERHPWAVVVEEQASTPS